jgi:hypothetical protein
MTVNSRARQPIRTSTTNPWSVCHVYLARGLAGITSMQSTFDVGTIESPQQLLLLCEHILGACLPAIKLNRAMQCHFSCLAVPYFRAMVSVDDAEKMRTASDIATTFSDFPVHLFHGEDAKKDMKRWSPDQCRQALRWSWNRVARNDTAPGTIDARYDMYSVPPG